MKTTAFISALALAGSSVAAPAKNSAFALVAAHSASPVHLQSINANGGHFWIGKRTSAYCPNEPSQCPSDKHTSFVGADGPLAMNVEVPGGQRVYIQSNGALGYTEPHSSIIPAGAKYGHFRRQNEKGQNYDTLHHKGGFHACPVEKGGPYKIFVGDEGFDRKDCLAFDALVGNVKGFGAWEYV